MRSLWFTFPVLIFALAALFAASPGRAPTALAVPANDNFANAITIAYPSKSGTVATVDTTGATTQGGETTSLSGCAPGGATPNTGATVWYTWTTTGIGGGVIFDTYGSNFDTVIAVYTGNALGSLTLVSCNDDFGSTRSSVVISNSPAQTYRIQVGGFLGLQGNLVLNASVGAHMVVNSTADNNVSDPVLTLREAMMLADINPGGVGRPLSAGEQAQIQTSGFGFGFGDLIHFSPAAFPPGAPQTIPLTGTLEELNTEDIVISAIGAGVIVDGQTLAFNCFTVGVNGKGHVFERMQVRRCADAFNVTEDNNAVTFNVITESFVGVRLTSATAQSNSVFFNFIGTNGVSALPNGIGIRVDAGADNNFIGFTNVISGNNNQGILITGSGTDGNVVMGNMIGTNPAGTAALPNTLGGVEISGGAQNNVIGGATVAERNVISGNASVGVVISGVGSTGNQVRGNYVGTNAAGTAALANPQGVIINLGATNATIGGTAAGQGNVISGNTFDGVRILDGNTSANTVTGNRIGTSAAGSADLGNGEHGVDILNGAHDNIVGGTTAGARNVISGNNINGVNIFGLGTDNNQVSGNYIGTDVTGAIDLGNAEDGVDIFNRASNTVVGGTTVGQRNVISGNSFGVTVSAAGTTGNVINGNYIGTNAAGTAAVANTNHGVLIFGGASNTTVGLSPELGNVISGNGGHGVHITDSSTFVNLVKGNRIGTNAAGTAALPNLRGVDIVASPGNTLENNVISGNTLNGVGITFPTATQNTLVGNIIGADITGSAALGNGAHGVFIGSAPSNVIGNTSGGGNLIAFNGLSFVDDPGVGIYDPDAYANTVRGNSIHSNAGPGIEILNGANQNPTAPTIFSIAGSTVNGSACPNCTVDIYSDDAGEGRHYHVSTVAAPSGFFSASVTAIASALTATSTHAGNTSRFSAPFAVAERCDGADNDGDTLVDEGNPNSDGDGLANCVDPDDDNDGVLDGADACSAAEDVDGFEDADGCPDPDNDQDGICDAGQTASSCSGSDTGKYCFDAAGTLPCHIAPPSDCRSVAEDLDAFKDTDGCPEPDNDNDAFPDATDACPGTDSQSGADGMLGSPQDLNHNGIKDGAEATLTTDDVLTYAFEDRDGVLDTDGCHDSPGEDFDSDGYTDDNEALKIGTDAGYPCGIGGWPSNVFDGGASANKFDVQDIISFVAPVRRLDTNPTGPTAPRFDARWDLSPGVNSPFTTFISIYDVTTMLTGNPGSPAYPPMFGGPRAFGKTCPLAAQ